MVMKAVAIIGGGITGLTAAFYLQRRGFDVTVYEAGDRVGGVIRSLRADGFLAEFGPNTLLETTRQISQLIQDAGLQARRLDTDPKARARYVVRNGRPVPMPHSPPGFLATKLFTWKAKLAALREPFVPRRRDGVEESIAQFVTRRFNQEFLDHAVDALVAGVYAGDPYQLSVAHAFPKLKALEDNYGSMIKGQIFGARERKRRGEVAKDRAPKFSFDEGLQVLPDTLAEHLGRAVRLKTAVTKLVRTAQGWTVHFHTTQGAVTANHGAVIFCGTATKLAELQLEGESNPPTDGAKLPPDLTAFAEIHYPPVSSVVLGFRRADVAHDCSGFGMLIPKIEGFKSLGTIFSSSLFPNRAPSGHLTLTTYVGGARRPESAQFSDDELVQLVCDDLRTLLGVRGEPVFRHVARYPRAIPQYNVGYGRFKERMQQLEQHWPGFFLAGHYRDGVSLSDSMLSGIRISERVATCAASLSGLI